MLDLFEMLDLFKMLDCLNCCTVYDAGLFKMLEEHAWEVFLLRNMRFNKGDAISSTVYAVFEGWRS
jgi:hypothetical protein